MTEILYNVVFSGGFDDGRDLENAKGDLARLFKVDLDRIETLFRRKGAVIKKGVNRPTGLKYIQRLKKAGVLCRLQEQAPPSPTRTGTRQPTSNRDQTASSPDQIQVVDPPAAPAELAYSPVPANRITAAPGGINMNRPGLKAIAYRDVVLISVFTDLRQENTALLVFVRELQRPFICQANKIAFTEFPGVKETSLVASLRNFLHFILREHPRLAVDTHTHRFINGRPPSIVDLDINKITTALAKAIASGSRKTASVNAPPSLHDTAPDPRAVAAPKATVAPMARTGLATVPRSANPSPSLPAVTPAQQAREGIQNTETWTSRAAFSQAVLLLAGFAFPLLKHSIMFGGSVLVWPWELFGVGPDAQHAAATATFSNGQHLGLWGLVPLLAGAAIMATALFAGHRARHLIMLVGGTAVLVLWQTLLFEEGEILGLFFIPPTAAGGAMTLVAVMAGAWAAVGNRLRKSFPAKGVPRLLLGAGGVLLGLSTILAFLASEGPYKGWPMMMLYLGLLVYALCGVRAAWQTEADTDLAALTSSLARGILIWAPLACALAQRFNKDPFMNFVIGGGGGIFNILFSITKAFLVYYGSAFAAATGLAGILAVRWWHQTARRHS